VQLIKLVKHRTQSLPLKQNEWVGVI